MDQKLPNALNYTKIRLDLLVWALYTPSLQISWKNSKKNFLGSNGLKSPKSTHPSLLRSRAILRQF
jgi:hypothetical protein